MVNLPVALFLLDPIEFGDGHFLHRPTITVQADAEAMLDISLGKPRILF